MTAPPAAAPYPATFSLDAPLTMARWRPLAQWILAIPHFIIGSALGTVSQAVASSMLRKTPSSWGSRVSERSSIMRIIP